MYCSNLNKMKNLKREKQKISQYLQAILTKLLIILRCTCAVVNQHWNSVNKMGSKTISDSTTETPWLINNTSEKDHFS